MSSAMDTSFEGKGVAQPKSSTNVQVVVRCRPASTEERARGVSETVHCDTMANEVHVALNKIGEKVFSYDRVYDPHSSQRQIYEDVVEPLVMQTLRGYNTTVLAYGQTGTGKTHTMEGEIDNPENMGVIPRAMQSIFRTLASRGDTESYVKASYLEIYNENLMDLLSASPANELPQNQQLRIIEDKTKTGRGVVVHNLEEVLVKSWEDIQKVMKMAMSKRKIAATDLNERSSRSHAVFTVTVHLKEYSPDGEELLRVGKINLVDLAGSECVARSGSKDMRAREAGSINQSLLTLGRVITALVEKSPHVAYRDSKLTRLLQESLGGCSLTLMIATVAPSVHCLDETLSTLEYASRAKAIKNKPVANQKMSKRVAIREYVEEIERLRTELQAARAKDGVYLPEEQYQQLVLHGKSTSLRVQDLEALMEKRLGELQEVKAQFAQTSSELKKTSAELDLERDRLARTKEELHKKELELVEERRVCEERQAIIDAHVSTESRLLLVHDELQERLKNAKDRLTSLHEKLDRKNTVERENDRLVQDFRKDLERRTLELEQTLRDGKNVSLERLNKVQEWIDRLNKFVCEDVRSSQDTHRHRSVEAFQQFVDRVQSLSSDKMHADLNRIAKEGASNVIGFSEAAQGFYEGLREHEEAIAGARQANEAETLALRTEVIQPLIQEIERSRMSTLAFTESLSIAFSSLQAATQALVVGYESRMTEMESQMRRMIDTEKQRSKRATEKAREKIAFILASLNEDSEYELERMMDQAKHSKQISMKIGREQAQGVAQTFELIQNGNDNWVALERERSRLAVDEARSANDSAQFVAKNAWEEVDERSDEAMSHLRRGASDANAAKSRVESSMQVTLAEIKERENKNLNEFKAAQRAWLDVTRVGAEEAQEMENRAMALLAQTKKDLVYASEHSESLCAGSVVKLEDARDVMERFHLREDRSTGRTPSRLQMFEWTKERPQTSPHSRIVERVRKGKNVSGLLDIEDVTNHSISSLNSSTNPATSVKRSLSRSSSSNMSSSTSSVAEQNKDWNNENSNPGGLDEATFESMKIQELRSALKEKGLNVKGDKTTLKTRLRRASLGELVEGDE